MPSINAQLNIDRDLPQGLHEKIMAAIVWLKWRFSLFAVLIALTASLAYLSIRIGFKIMDSSAIDVVQAMLSGFDLSMDYFTQSVSGLLEVLPMTGIYILSLNALFALAALSIMYKMHKNFKKLTIKL